MKKYRYTRRCKLNEACRRIDLHGRTYDYKYFCF